MIINANTINIKKEYASDGCTGVPDVKGTNPEFFVHDGLYQFAPFERILCDFIFYYVMNKNNCPVDLLYFDRVRVQAQTLDNPDLGVTAEMVVYKLKQDWNIDVEIR